MLIDPPVGTIEERRTGKVWPGAWQDSNPFCSYYQLAPGVWNYHPGSDLNLNKPTWNADLGAGIYAIADGTVTYSGPGGGSWGHLIVIEHTNPKGEKFYSRTAHVNHLVQAGGMVARTNDQVHIGQQIARVGDADGYYGPAGAHLHFDISTTVVLKHRPDHWPGVKLEELKANYVDPKLFILTRRQDGAVVKQGVTADTLTVRAQPGLLGVKVGKLAKGITVTVAPVIALDGFTWYKISSGEFVGGYVADAYLKFV